jgi:hypothetical protein
MILALSTLGCGGPETEPITPSSDNTALAAALTKCADPIPASLHKVCDVAPGDKNGPIVSIYTDGTSVRCYTGPSYQPSAVQCNIAAKCGLSAGYDVALAWVPGGGGVGGTVAKGIATAAGKAAINEACGGCYVKKVDTVTKGGWSIGEWVFGLTTPFCKGNAATAFQQICIAQFGGG